MKKFVLPLVAAAFLGGCADGAGPESSATATSVSIRFGVAGAAASPSSMASFSVAGGAATHPGHIVAPNGDELNISEIRVIIEEFELEPVDTADCDDDMGTDDCEEFEQRFFFINVPLDGTFTDVTTEAIPVGRYDELEIEVDNVHVHGDDSPEDVALIALLFGTIIPGAGFVDGDKGEWPADASMVVIGTFTPAGGGETPVPFTTFFEAEIEIELEFDSPLDVVDGSPVIINVALMLEKWFENGNGLLNLADSKFQDLDRLVEFELEIEDGFEVEIEIHHHN